MSKSLTLENFSLPEYRLPVPPKRNSRRTLDKVASEEEPYRKSYNDLQGDMAQSKENSEKFHILYERQKNLSELRTEELLELEMKYEQLEKSHAKQEKLIIDLNHENDKLSEELKDKSSKLEDTTAELNLVIGKSEELAKTVHDLEKQLHISETSRNIEQENLRNLQASFQASEKHFTSVLEQVQSLIQENELAYETNCKLQQEKLKVERDLSIRNKVSSSLTAELAEVQDKMQQINETLKTFEHEKAYLYKKMQEQQSVIAKFDNEILEISRQLENANQHKSDLEGQLKLANLCLSRALSDKDKDIILPHKNEIKPQLFHADLSPSYRILQEDIAAKDIIISRLIEENKKLEDQLQKCKMELQKQQEINNASKMWNESLHHVPKELHQEIHQRDKIIDSMKVTIEKVISERNRLGLKCMRRKEQAVLLKEKNKVLEEIMLIGNRLYEEGLKKIRNMKMAQENVFSSPNTLVEIVSGSKPTSPCKQITNGKDDIFVARIDENQAHNTNYSTGSLLITHNAVNCDDSDEAMNI